MGCGASSRRQHRSAVTEPLLCGPEDSGAQALSSRAPPAALTAGAVEDSPPEVRSLARALGLEQHLPQLHALGVRSVADVADLYVEDLEGAGLTRVQVRQLQRAAASQLAGHGEASSALREEARMPGRECLPGAAPSPVGAKASQPPCEAVAAEDAGARVPRGAPPREQASPQPRQRRRPSEDSPGSSAAADALEEALELTINPRPPAPQRQDSGPARSGAAGHGAVATALSSRRQELAADRRSPPTGGEGEDRPLLAGGWCGEAAASKKSSANLATGSDLFRISGTLSSTVFDFDETAPPAAKPAAAFAPAAAPLPPAAPCPPIAAAEVQDIEETLLPQEPAPKRQVGSRGASAEVGASRPPAVAPAAAAAERTIEETLLPDPPAGGPGRPIVPVRSAPPAVAADVVVGDIEETLMPSSAPAPAAAAGVATGDIEETLMPASAPGGCVIDMDFGPVGRGCGAPKLPGARPSQQQAKQINKELGRMLDNHDCGEGPIGSSMPEALRKRLERRAQERSLSRQAASGGGGSPEHSAESPRRAAKTPPQQPGGLAQHSDPTMRIRGHSVEPGAASRASPSTKAGGAGGAGSSARAQSEGGGRQMFDKNELRLQRRDVFCEALTRYRAKMDAGARTPSPDPSICTLRPHDQPIRIYARKRPMKADECTQKREYDVATVLRGRPFPTKLVLHNCLFQADLKTPFVNHLQFEFDHVFGEDSQNDQVYRMAAFDLVLASRSGGVGTMFMFGQTGSGKTHTMTAIEEKAAHDLFEGAEPGRDWIAMQFIELRGNRCFDLLAPVPKDKMPELRLRESGDGSFFAEGATSVSPKSPAELVSAIRTAHARRATSATEANSVSSRSHALCTLRVLKTQGQLTLADCAGTERRKDSMYHSRERQTEAAEINASLHALKECVRYAAKREAVPAHAYRASSLTKLLSGAFAREDHAQLAVICTVSPCASDTEHTLSTLRTGMTLGGRGAEKEEKEQLSIRRPDEPPPPAQWDPSQVRAWLAEVGFPDVADALPSNFDGKMLVRVPEARCTQLCGGDARRGAALYANLKERIRVSKRGP